MPSYRLHIEGQVQGVGFRPHVFRTAQRLGLTGWVKNGNDGVHIQISGSEDSCLIFIREITQQPPQHARITRQQVVLIENPGDKHFKIIQSHKETVSSLLLTPDLGLCEDCRKEIKNSSDRRYEYAFTTCIDCGPRYSVIQSLPYDRENTSMADFVMCPVCQQEYNDPENRRYYSQTNSCPHCGVSLALLTNRGNELSQVTTEIPEMISNLLHQGRIIAVKGVGGFLLLADATNARAIARLRERKHRPSKPFALLYPSLELVERHIAISEYEKEALQSTENPIVLLTIGPRAKNELAVDQISPGLTHIGIMLPGNPLLELIAAHWEKPLIATSGNLSGSPVFYENEKAILNLRDVADYFLVNNRDIVVPQDDSVIQFTNDHHQIILRRSRGLAPTFLPNRFHSEQTIFASGGELKSAFAFLNKENLYVSQYLGDLENFETQENYRHLLDHFIKLLEAKPSKVLVDAHPNYYSSKIGKELAATWEVPVIPVQHHIAHFSAVLAENELLQCKDQFLGIIWDGTGWGEDGQIWGGEFFIYNDYHFKRVSHLDYFDHLLGDKTSREPRLSAMSLCFDLEEAHSLLKPKFNSTEWNLYSGMLQQSENLKTSSMGRLFDGVACLLGLCDKSSYEGEAALLLEACATCASSRIDWLTIQNNFSLKSYLRNLAIEIQMRTPKEILAYQFHVALVHWIEEVAVQQETKNLAFSGGVFQNALLSTLIRKTLGKNFNLYFHKQLSPNDESIGFGQLAYDQIQRLKAISNHEKDFKTETI